MNAPRFEISLLDSPHAPRTTHHAPLPPSFPSRPSVKKRKPLTEREGQVTIPIYKTRWTSKRLGRTYLSYTIAWRDAAGRHREKYSSLDDARARAKQLALDISNGKIEMLDFTPADKAEFQAARQNLRPIGSPSLLVVTAEIADLVTQAGSLANVREAVTFWQQHRPKGATAQSIPDLVTSLLADKAKTGKGQKWLGTLSQQLTRFATSFTCPLHALRAHEITAWLDDLHATRNTQNPSLSPFPSVKKPVGLRTRKNYRDAIRELVRYAQAKGQLARTWDELARVEDVEPAPVEVEIYTPDQLLKLLVARQALEERGRSGATLIPFLTLQAFAGIRHEEMRDRSGRKPLLDWSNIDLEKGFIRLRAVVSKTKKLRLIEMHPNLVAWLTPYAKPSGPICALSQTAGALDRAKKLAGLPNKRGQLTNALRSSFISYRLAETNDIGLVAREAGNSPNVIRENYLELVTKPEAQRWFGLHPTQADILPLFAWGKTNRPSPLQNPSASSARSC